MKFNNPTFIGGNHQFAETIINKSKVLDQTDAKFLQLIHDNTQSDQERNEPVIALESIKSEEVSLKNERINRDRAVA